MSRNTLLPRLISMENYQNYVDSHPLLIFFSFFITLFSEVPKSSAHSFLCLCYFLSPCLPSSSSPQFPSWSCCILSTASQWANRCLAHGCCEVPLCIYTALFLFLSLLDHLSSAFSLFNPTVGFRGTTDSTPGQVLCFLFKHSSNRGLRNTCTHTHTHRGPMSTHFNT